MILGKKRLAAGLLCILLVVCTLPACETGKVPANSDASYPQTIVSEPAASEISQVTETPLKEEEQEESVLKITVGDYEFSAVFEDNSSAREFKELLSQGPITITMEEYGGFEKVGSLGTSLPRNDTYITTQPGDIILYQGNQITIYYGVNSWNFTRLARISDPSGLQEKLGDGTISATFSIE